jgi:hypothetical protein
MLSADEREQIVSILWEWAEMVPDVPVAGFLRADPGEPRSILTPRELAIGALEGTPDGEALLEILEHGLRREGIETLKRRFTQIEGRW